MDVNCIQCKGTGKCWQTPKGPLNQRNATSARQQQTGDTPNFFNRNNPIQNPRNNQDLNLVKNKLFDTGNKSTNMGGIEDIDIINSKILNDKD